MGLMDKLKKNCTIKEASVLSKSKFFSDKDTIQTDIPIMNIALSGSIDGGFIPGVITISGKSKHFKTSFALIMARAYLNKYEDAVLLFYDTEFGSPQDYFESYGIDTNRIFHVPITDLEQLKQEAVKQLKELERNDKVMIIIDSIGNIASIREINNALDGKSTADMTRAAQLKSFFRMVTPIMRLKNIPMVCINHVYDNISSPGSAVICSGGQGPYLASDVIFVIGRQQEKDGTDLVGFNFIINVEKSRYVKEKSKFPVQVTYEKGPLKFSGLLDIAVETGHIIKPSMGWYQRVDKSTGEVLGDKFRAKATQNEDFWKDLLKNESFNEDIKNLYKLTMPKDVLDGDIEDSLSELDDIEEDLEELE